MQSAIKKIAAPVRDCYLKYCSEVGYLRRDLHWQISHFTERQDIARRRHLASQIRLPADDARIVETLNATGMSKVTLSSLCPELPLLSYLSGLAAAHGEQDYGSVAQGRKGRSKSYWTDIWRPPAQGPDPLMQFVCHPRILSIAAKYLGQAPILQGVNFYYSPASGDGGAPLIGSQGWHRDNDQKTRLKIFLSPFSITSRNGPTTCLPMPYSDERLYRNYPGYFNDAQAAAFGLETGRSVELLAEPGEFHFADTSRLYHFGSRSVEASRWLVIISYGPVESHLRQKNRRKFYGASNQFARENERIVELLSPDRRPQDLEPAGAVVGP